MKVHLSDGDRARVRASGTSSIKAWAHWQDAYCGWNNAIDESLQVTRKAVEKALFLVPDDAGVLLSSATF